MDDALKRRLTGAVVLVSLAVIFVPMLVEEEPVLSPSIRESNIPVRPPPVLIDPESRRPPPPGPRDAGTADAATDAAADLSLPAPEKAAETSVAEVPPAPPSPAPEAAPPEPVQKRVTGTPPPVEPVPAVAAPEPPKAPEKPAEAPAKASKPPSGWVVQVGTFADKGNAERTLARLRASGYDSFIEEIRVSGKVMHRVRVGPEIQRDRAEAQRAEILTEFKLKGQVLKYP